MNHLPPAARVAADSGRTDASRGERIAYVITQGLIGSKLSEQVKPPSTLLSGSEVLNLEYYVTKQVIPAVQRIFGPLANRAFTWLSIARGKAGPPPQSVDQQCLLCGCTTASSIFKGNSKVPLFCITCASGRQNQAIATSLSEVRKAEQRVVEIRKACLHCAGCPEAADMCTDAYHCEIYFQRDAAAEQLKRAYKNLQRMGFYSEF
jgi:DNA polymerase zeta